MGDLVMSAAELNEFLDGAFPGAPRGYRVEQVDLDGIRMRAPGQAPVGQRGAPLE